jgi:aryl-phospho-beta-D-glucosidase BglC (GH1 family)
MSARQRLFGSLLWLALSGCHSNAAGDGPPLGGHSGADASVGSDGGGATDGGATVPDSGGESSPITAQQAILLMQRGINLGNSFDAPGGETSWGNPEVQDYYFDDYKAAGFTAVRIPVTWDQHTDTNAPYAIDDTFLTRVEQVVDWGLSRGLFIIINAHHEAWLKGDFSDANVARFNAIWTQVATRFKDKSDRLLFEILNEPNPMSLDNLNSLNDQIFALMRQTNPTRLIVYAGTNYSGDGDLEQAKVPAGVDQYTIANFHCYDPWSFVSGGPDVIWGSQADKDAIKATFDGVAQFAASKGIPVMVNELGAGPNHDYNSRTAFYQTYVDNTIRNGMAFFAWDDGGDFQTYDRQLPVDHMPGGQWIGQVKDEMTENVFSANGIRAVYSSRSSGGAPETTSDVGGGSDLGNLTDGTWMTYLIDVPKSGDYKLEYRVASLAGGGVMQASTPDDGTSFATIAVPSTGGWQTWTTITQTVTLTAGIQDLQLTAQKSGFNLNWIRLSQ